MNEFVVNPEYPNYRIYPDGRVFTRYHKPEWVEMKPFINNDHMGYKRISLFTAEGKRKNIFVHRLVAETFVLNPNNYPCVNHKDENILNNSASNLEWCTHAYNNRYGDHLKHCVPALLQSVEKSKIPVIGIDKNGGEHLYYSITEAARETRAFSANIRKCLNGERKKAGGYRWIRKGEDNGSD